MEEEKILVEYGIIIDDSTKTPVTPHPYIGLYYCSSKTAFNHLTGEIIKAVNDRNKALTKSLVDQ